jgi:putative heme-binding domain-containing protein
MTFNDSQGPVLNIVSGVNNVTEKWPMIQSTGMESRARFGLVRKPEDTWLGYAEIDAVDAAAVEFFAASTGLETIWLNDKQVFKREKPAAIGPYPDRFDATLTKGINRVLVRFGDAREWADFQLRFRRKSATPVQERYTAASLSRAGNPARGKEIFMNAEKSQCLKCHRVGDAGEKFGPELTGLGSRFSKAHIIESILDPSRAISPSFETVVIDLKNERSVSGLKVEETETTVVLIDNQAKKHVLAKIDIDSRRKGTLSTMPDGFEKTLTEDEFVDLISYLVSLKADRGK